MSKDTSTGQSYIFHSGTTATFFVSEETCTGQSCISLSATEISLSQATCTALECTDTTLGKVLE